MSCVGIVRWSWGNGCERRGNELRVARGKHRQDFGAKEFHGLAVKSGNRRSDVAQFTGFHAPPNGLTGSRDERRRLIESDFVFAIRSHEENYIKSCNKDTMQRRNYDIMIFDIIEVEDMDSEGREYSESYIMANPIPARCKKCGHKWIDGEVQKVVKYKNGMPYSTTIIANDAIRAPALSGCRCFYCGGGLGPLEKGGPVTVEQVEQLKSREAAQPMLELI